MARYARHASLKFSARKGVWELRYQGNATIASSYGRDQLQDALWWANFVAYEEGLDLKIVSPGDEIIFEKSEEN